MKGLKQGCLRVAVAFCALALSACASVSIDRSEIAEGSTIAVLSNIEDNMFVNDMGVTIFERQEDAYIPLDGWDLSGQARGMVIKLIESDPKFRVIDNDNRGAAGFADHIQWTATNFGQLDDNTARVQQYCAAENIDFLLLLQPGFATDPMVVLPANRGFGYDQRRLFGNRTATAVGYASLVLLYDCVTGKEIQSLNEVVWDRKDVADSLELEDSGIQPAVESQREEHTERYLGIIEDTVRKVKVFSIAG